MEGGSYDKSEFRANLRPQLGQNLRPKGEEVAWICSESWSTFKKRYLYWISSANWKLKHFQLPCQLHGLKLFKMYGTYNEIGQLRTILDNFDYNYGHESNNSHDLATAITLHGLHRLCRLWFKHIFVLYLAILKVENSKGAFSHFQMAFHCFVSKKMCGRKVRKQVGTEKIWSAKWNYH